MGASSKGRIAVLDVFRELRAVVSGEEGKTKYAETRRSLFYENPT